MPKLTKITRVTLSGMAVAILLPVAAETFIELAKEQGLYDKPSENLEAVMDWFSSPWATPTAILFTGLALGSWLDFLLRKFDKRQAQNTDTSQLESVLGRTFKNETVMVDGKNFIRCAFRNVRLKYRGGSYNFNDCDIQGYVLEGEDPIVSNTISIMQRLEAF